MAEPQSGNEPIGGHPESVDPPWFQELVRRAFEREMRRYQKLGADADESLERAMWYVFELRNIRRGPPLTCSPRWTHRSIRTPRYSRSGA